MSEITDLLNRLIAFALENPAVLDQALRAAKKGEATVVWALACPDIRQALSEREDKSPGFREACSVAVAGYIVELRTLDYVARLAQVEPDGLDPNECWIIAVGHG